MASGEWPGELASDAAAVRFARALLDHAASGRPEERAVTAALDRWREAAAAEQEAEQAAEIRYEDEIARPQAVREADYRAFVQGREQILRRWEAATHAQRRDIQRELLAYAMPDSLAEAGVHAQRLFTKTSSA